MRETQLTYYSFLTRGPLAIPNKTDHKTGVLHAPLFANSVWVLLRPTGLLTLTVYETGPTVYRPYPRRLESLPICRCHYKGSTFSSSKILNVGPTVVRY